jgi:hypothetical protein
VTVVGDPHVDLAAYGGVPPVDRGSGELRLVADRARPATSPHAVEFSSTTSEQTTPLRPHVPPKR